MGCDEKYVDITPSLYCFSVKEFEGISLSDDSMSRRPLLQQVRYHFHYTYKKRVVKVKIVKHVQDRIVVRVLDHFFKRMRKAVKGHITNFE